VAARYVERDGVLARDARAGGNAADPARWDCRRHAIGIPGSGCSGCESMAAGAARGKGGRPARPFYFSGTMSNASVPWCFKNCFRSLDKRAFGNKAPAGRVIIGNPCFRFPMEDGMPAEKDEHEAPIVES
jgi:hypothetical protein